MDKKKLASFVFDLTGLDLDKLLDGLEVNETLERHKIESAINDFESYISERHSENPDFENILSFWRKNHVCEELIKIRYSLDSKFKSYSEFKEHLSEKFGGRTDVKDFSNNLMDELEKYLYDTVKDTSNLTQADIAVHNEMHEKTRSEFSNLAKKQDKILRRIETRENLSPNQYYNLFVSFEEGIYDKSPFKFYNERVLKDKFTIHAIRDKFSEFKFADIQEIVALPTLFLPEYRNAENEKESVGYFGWLNDIDIDLESVKSEFYFEKEQQFPMTKIVQLMNDLKIKEGELERTHLAIKKADLLEVIKKL